jgi:hypothetical protein
MTVDLESYAAELATVTGSDIATAREVIEEAASVVRPDLLRRAIRSLAPAPEFGEPADPFAALSDDDLATLARAIHEERDRRRRT